MPTLSAAFARQRLCLDFTGLKHAYPEGVYAAPVPDEPLQWLGVLFVRKGPYAGAILRFRIDFPPEYPARPPTVALLTDVFHPLVSPLTTYSYSARDSAAGPASAADRHRLPPGGLSLRHGFPEWFGEAIADETQPNGAVDVRTLEILLYLRVVFDTPAVLDSVPLDSAANTSAWHAWRSYRAQAKSAVSIADSKSPATASPVSASIDEAHRSPTPAEPRRGGATPSIGSAIPAVAQNAPSTTPSTVGTISTTASTIATAESVPDRSASPRLLQPGGARKPGEWNWQGVWEERVTKSIRASLTDNALFAADYGDVVNFADLDPVAIKRSVPWLVDTGG